MSSQGGTGEHPRDNIGATSAGDLVQLDFDHTDVEPVQLFGVPLPLTFTVRTGHGWHLYYRKPRATAGAEHTNGYVQREPNVEVKTDGGYVVGPGSVHPDGHTYDLVHDAPVADLPVGLHHVLTMRKLSGAANRSGQPRNEKQPLDRDG